MRSALQEPIKALYRSWKGNLKIRFFLPKSVGWLATEWHPEENWSLFAFDTEKSATRNFCLEDCDFKSAKKLNTDLTPKQEALETVAEAMWENLGSDLTFQEAKHSENKSHRDSYEWVMENARLAIKAWIED